MNKQDFLLNVVGALEYPNKINEFKRITVKDKTFTTWDGDLKVSVKNVESDLDNGDYDFKFEGVDSDTTPRLEERPMNSTCYDVSFKKLKLLVNETSREKIRYFICGVCIDSKQCLVATDGMSLIVMDEKVEGLSKDNKMTMPSSELRKVIKIASKSKLDSFDVYTNEELGRIRLESGSFSFEFKNINGKFPNYESLLPKGNDFEVKTLLSKDKVKSMIDDIKAQRVIKKERLYLTKFNDVNVITESQVKKLKKLHYYIKEDMLFQSDAAGYPYYFNESGIKYLFMPARV